MTKIEKDIKTMERDIRCLVRKINKYTCDGVGDLIITVINLETRLDFMPLPIYKGYYTGRAASIIYYAARENPRVLGYLLGAKTPKKEKNIAMELLRYLQGCAVSKIAGDNEEELIDDFTNWAGICNNKTVKRIAKKTFGVLDMYFGKFFAPMVH
jgi:hypothetical protein